MDIDLFFANDNWQRLRLGSDPCREVVEAVRFYESIGLRAVRLDADDWVTLADIGQRIGRSRENVRLWSSGRYGPRNFPPPLNPGRDTSFYSWTEVSVWLRANKTTAEGDEEEPLPVALNLAIQLRRLLPRLRRPEAVLSLLSPSPTDEPTPPAATSKQCPRSHPLVMTSSFSH